MDQFKTSVKFKDFILKIENSKIKFTLDEDFEVKYDFSPFCFYYI
jgi:hypothetical protein